MPCPLLKNLGSYFVTDSLIRHRRGNREQTAIAYESEGTLLYGEVFELLGL